MESSSLRGIYPEKNSRLHPYPISFSLSLFPLCSLSHVLLFLQLSLLSLSRRTLSMGHASCKALSAAVVSNRCWNKYVYCSRQKKKRMTRVWGNVKMKRGKHTVEDMYAGWYRQMERKKKEISQAKVSAYGKLEQLMSVENRVNSSFWEVNTGRAHTFFNVAHSKLSLLVHYH